MALLEADVALPVVRDFIARVKDKALGQEVRRLADRRARRWSGIVHRELAATMGATTPRSAELESGDAAAGGDPDGRPAGRGQDHDHRQAGQAPDRKAQEEGADGVGRRLPPGGHRAVEDGDRARPAPSGFRPTPDQKPRDIALRRARPRQAPLFRRAARRHRRPAGDRRGADGRDHASCTRRCNPVETLFVVDAMQGQDAVNTAKAFKEALPLTGIVLTKLDGDARGGAALSVRQITGAPIKFAGVSREARRPGGLRRRAPRRPRAGHGRHRRAGRRGAEGRRHRRGAEAGRQGQERRRLRPRTTSCAQIAQMKKHGRAVRR